MTIDNVPTGTRAHPRGQFDRRLAMMGGSTDVSELARNALPLPPVARFWARDRMSDLMKQCLMHIVITESRREVSRNRNPLRRVVAEPGAALGVVEAERPCVVKVQTNEGIRPHLHALQI